MKPPTVAHAIWTFLNTSLGIWVLSSLVLGGISFGYVRVQQQFLAKREKALLTQRINTEIRSRIRQWLRLATTSQIQSRFGGPEEFAFFYTWLTQPPSVINHEPYDIYGVFPEYKDRSLLSLAIELRGNSEGQTADQLDRVTGYLLVWSPLLDVQPTFAAYRDKIQENLWLPQWRYPTGSP